MSDSQPKKIKINKLPQYACYKLLGVLARQSDLAFRIMMNSLIDEIEPEVIIHCHSWKPCIVLTGEKCQREAEFLSECRG